MVNYLSMLHSIRMCFFHIFKASLAQKHIRFHSQRPFYYVLSRAERNNRDECAGRACASSGVDTAKVCGIKRNGIFERETGNGHISEV